MKNPDWSKYKNGEIVEFFQLLIKINENYDLVDLSLDSEVNSMATTFTELEAVFKASSASELTKNLRLLDDLRDKDIRALEKAVDFNLLHYEENRKNAAEAIKAVLNKYGSNIDELKYSIQTATIRNLYRDCVNDATVLDAVNLLGLKPLLDHLNTTNELFEKSFLARNREGVGVSQYSFVELKQQIIEKYKVYIKTLDSRAFLSVEDKYNNLLQEVINIIDKSNRDSRSRTREVLPEDGIEDAEQDDSADYMGDTAA